jgi:hypothetical protein
MKKTRSTKIQVMIAASAAVAIPLFSDPAFAQIKDSIKVGSTKNMMIKSNIKFTQAAQKAGDRLTIAGVDGTHTIFKTATGTFFFLDEVTGDIKTVSSNYTVKLTHANLSKIKGSITQKGRENTVKLIGVDTDSHVIMQNKREEKFYLNKLGDMVFVTID